VGAIFASHLDQIAGDHINLSLAIALKHFVLFNSVALGGFAFGCELGEGSIYVGQNKFAYLNWRSLGSTPVRWQT
jgi:hypothetical protein